MPATIVVPYVDGMLSGETFRVVKLSGYHYRLVQLDRADPGGYARLIRRLWRFPCNIVLVEHDVEPTVGQLKEIGECGHDWCGYEYDNPGAARGPHFGCVRFSRRLMARCPVAADTALATGPNREQDRHWGECDAHLARDLFIRGETWQAHPGTVHHARP